MEGNSHSPQSRSVPNNPATSLGIVIDRSSSLKAKINSQSPSFFELENLFVKKILKDKAIKDYSITLFAGKPYYPSSTKLKPLLKIAPSEENDGSAIYNAILASALLDGALKPGHPPYSILLLTDGFDNSSSISEKTLTNLLLRNNIRLDVVAFASKNDSIYYSFNDSTGFERIKNLQEFCDVKRIARNTNGEFVLVDSDSQIQNALRKIKSKIANRESPLQQEDDDFNPDETLLNSLYNEIESSTRLKF